VDEGSREGEASEELLAPATGEDRPAPVAEPDLLTQVGAIAGDVAALRQVVEDRLQYDAVKESAFGKLYEDLDQFRGQAGFQQTRPLLVDLILLLDRIDNALAVDGALGEQTAFVASLRDEVAEVLARRGVLALPDAETFDPKVHRAVEVEAAADEAQHNSVARTVRRGYECDGMLLRPGEVVVRRFPKPTVEATP
jgi:molecular chaperone GrpE (heat shock protein)